MAGEKSSLMGARSRDQFKFLHKKLLSNQFYALDSDLELIEKYPKPFIVARLDFKIRPDHITFTEAIAYNQLVNAPLPWFIPVYIIEAEPNFTCPTDNKIEIVKHSKQHKFSIYKYLQGDWYPEPPIIEMEEVLFQVDWNTLRYWESCIRKRRREQMENYYNER